MVGRADHEAIAVTLHEKACVALMKDKIDEAAKLSAESLLMLRRLHGDCGKNSKIAMALYWVALAALAKSDFDKATERCKECLETRRYMFCAKKEHPFIVDSLHLQAMIEFECGNLTQAIEAGEMSVEMYRRVYSFDQNHWRLVKAKSDLTKLRGAAATHRSNATE